MSPDLLAALAAFRVEREALLTAAGDSYTPTRDPAETLIRVEKSVEAWHRPGLVLARFEGDAPSGFWAGKWVWAASESEDDDSPTLDRRGSWSPFHARHTVEHLAEDGYRVVGGDDPYRIPDGPEPPAEPHPLEGAFRAYKDASNALTRARAKDATYKVAALQDLIQKGVAIGSRPDRHGCRWALIREPGTPFYTGHQLDPRCVTEPVLFDGHGYAVYQDIVLDLEKP